MISARRNTLGALALIVLWVTMPLVGVVHSSMETHRYCAEHQAFEHERNASSDVDQAAPKQDAVERGRDVQNHERCFAADCVCDADVVAASKPFEPTNAGSTAALVTSQCTTGPIAVIHTAPKNSPPPRRS